MPVRIIQLLVIACCITALSAQASAQARKCPANAHPDGEDAKNYFCTCNPGYEPRGETCAPIPRATLDAACTAAVAVKLIDGRLANLRKVIGVLGANEAQWDKAREKVLEERFETSKALFGEVALTLAIAAAPIVRAKTTAKNVADIAELGAKSRLPLAGLPGELAELQRLKATTTDVQLTKKILEYEGALANLGRAEVWDHRAHIMEKTVEAAHLLHGNAALLRTKPLEEVKIVSPGPGRLNTFADGLYKTSTFVGSIAIVFATGPAAAAALGGGIAAGVLVAGGELINYREQNARLASMDQDATKRNQMKMELNSRLNALAQERERQNTTVKTVGTTHCKR